MRITEANLLAIGRFAEKSRLSLKALRIYDRLGLLRPVRVDAESGYRYYHEDQLRRARLVVLLRRLDMPLATIRRALEASPEEARTLIDSYWSEVEARTAEGRQIVSYLRTIIEGGRAMELSMELKVKTREVGPQHAVTMQREVYVRDLPAFITDAFGKLFRHVSDQGGKAAGPGLVIYHGQVNEDSNGPVEVCLPVEAGRVEPAGEIRLANFPAHREAYTTITMAQCVFPEILKAYDAVYSWIEQNDHQMDGAPREVYFADPVRVGPNDPFCDIAWPFR